MKSAEEVARELDDVFDTYPTWDACKKELVKIIVRDRREQVQAVLPALEWIAKHYPCAFQNHPWGKAAKAWLESVEEDRSCLCRCTCPGYGNCTCTRRCTHHQKNAIQDNWDCPEHGPMTRQ